MTCDLCTRAPDLAAGRVHKKKTLKNGKTKPDHDYDFILFYLRTSCAGRRRRPKSKETESVDERTRGVVRSEGGGGLEHWRWRHREGKRFGFARSVGRRFCRCFGFECESAFRELVFFRRRARGRHRRRDNPRRPGADFHAQKSQPSSSYV